MPALRPMNGRLPLLAVLPLVWLLLFFAAPFVIVAIVSLGAQADDVPPVSLGASLFPQHGNSPREVLKNADIALYAAKGAGRGTLTIYDAELRQGMQRRLAMLQLARNAIADDRVIPYYQPKLDLLTGALEGFEALLRWRMPNGRIGEPAALEAA